MTATKALSGLRPLRKRGAGANTAGSNTYPIASAYATNIFTGDLVVQHGTTGALQVWVSASTANLPIGVFAGVEYEADGVPTFKKYWPANTSATNIKANVIDDPSQTYTIQADASITAGDMGTFNFAVTTGAGSTVTGRSGFGLEVGTRGDTGVLRTIAVHDQVGNAITTAFPIVEVRIAEHIDVQSTAGTSAG